MASPNKRQSVGCLRIGDSRYLSPTIPLAIKPWLAGVGQILALSPAEHQLIWCYRIVQVQGYIVLILCRYRETILMEDVLLFLDVLPPRLPFVKASLITMMMVMTTQIPITTVLIKIDIKLLMRSQHCRQISRICCHHRLFYGSLENKVLRLLQRWAVRNSCINIGVCLWFSPQRILPLLMRWSISLLSAMAILAAYCNNNNNSNNRYTSKGPSGLLPVFLLVFTGGHSLLEVVTLKIIPVTALVVGSLGIILVTSQIGMEHLLQSTKPRYWKVLVVRPVRAQCQTQRMQGL